MRPERKILAYLMYLETANVQAGQSVGSNVEAHLAQTDVFAGDVEGVYSHLTFVIHKHVVLVEIAVLSPGRRKSPAWLYISQFESPADRLITPSLRCFQGTRVLYTRPDASGHRTNWYRRI